MRHGPLDTIASPQIRVPRRLWMAVLPMLWAALACPAAAAPAGGTWLPHGGFAMDPGPDWTLAPTPASWRLKDTFTRPDARDIAVDLLTHRSIDGLSAGIVTRLGMRCADAGAAPGPKNVAPWHIGPKAAVHPHPHVQRYCHDTGIATVLVDVVTRAAAATDGEMRAIEGLLKRAGTGIAAQERNPRTPPGAGKMRVYADGLVHWAVPAEGDRGRREDPWMTGTNDVFVVAYAGLVPVRCGMAMMNIRNGTPGAKGVRVPKIDAPGLYEAMVQFDEGPGTYWMICESSRTGSHLMTVQVSRVDAWLMEDERLVKHVIETVRRVYAQDEPSHVTWDIGEGIVLNIAHPKDGSIWAVTKDAIFLELLVPDKAVAIGILPAEAGCAPKAGGAKGPAWLPASLGEARAGVQPGFHAICVGTPGGDFDVLVRETPHLESAEIATHVANMLNAVAAELRKVPAKGKVGR